MGSVSPAIVLSILAMSLLLAGCEQPSVESALLTAGVEAVPEEAPPQPRSIPVPSDEKYKWEVFATTSGEPRYLGREVLRCSSGCWSSAYDLESGSGQSLGFVGDGLSLVESRPPTGKPRRMLLGSPLWATMWRYQGITDGLGLGALTMLLRRLELAPRRVYRLTAFDLRQQLGYELTLRVGQAETVCTNWGERLCCPVELTPLGITAYLDEDGQPWLFRWAEGYAERRLIP